MRRQAMGIAAIVAATAGCWAAAAGAGAAAGIYYSDRGAESVVDAPYNEVVAAAQRALPEMGVPISDTDTDTDQEKRKTTLEGARTDGAGEVEVTVTQEHGQPVKVAVVARKTEVTWDKDFAGKVLERIVAYSK